MGEKPRFRSANFNGANFNSTFNLIFMILYVWYSLLAIYFVDFLFMKLEEYFVKTMFLYLEVGHFTVIYQLIYRYLRGIGLISHYFYFLCFHCCSIKHLKQVLVVLTYLDKLLNFFFCHFFKYYLNLFF